MADQVGDDSSPDHGHVALLDHVFQDLPVHRDVILVFVDAANATHRVFTRPSP